MPSGIVEFVLQASQNQPRPGDCGNPLTSGMAKYAPWRGAVAVPGPRYDLLQSLEKFSKRACFEKGYRFFDKDLLRFLAISLRFLECERLRGLVQDNYSRSHQAVSSAAQQILDQYEAIGPGRFKNPGRELSPLSRASGV